MKLYLLDENFEVIGPVNRYRTLIWRRRYYEPGIFELHTTSSQFKELNAAKYIFRNDRGELGVLKKSNIKTGDRIECNVKGMFAESILNERSIVRSNMSGGCESVLRRLVEENAISPSVSDRLVPHLVLGEEQGIGDHVRVQITGKPLCDKLYEIAATQEMSYRLRYDYVENLLKFEVWKGLDRTDDQTENSWAIFSDSFRNIRNAEYERDETEYKNYVYVAGEGEGNDRRVIEIDDRTDMSEARHEMFVDARDIQRVYYDENSNEHTYTTEEYDNLLRQRGLEKLLDHKKVEVLDAEVYTGGNLRYGIDFDLGDKVVYRFDKAGVEVEPRITEVSEVFEGASVSVSISFGNGYATSIKQIIRRETQ